MASASERSRGWDDTDPEGTLPLNWPGAGAVDGAADTLGRVCGAWAAEGRGASASDTASAAQAQGRYDATLGGLNGIKAG